MFGYEDNILIFCEQKFVMSVNLKSNNEMYDNVFTKRPIEEILNLNF